LPAPDPVFPRSGRIGEPFLTVSGRVISTTELLCFAQISVVWDLERDRGGISISAFHQYFLSWVAVHKTSVDIGNGNVNTVTERYEHRRILMAMTPAEKQRAYRQRQKERAEAEMKAGEDLQRVLRRPFSEWVLEDPNYPDFEMVLSLAGIPAPEFDDERGPEEFALNDVTVSMDEPFGTATGAIGRAEVIVGCLIDAASTLAQVVNTYKREEIGRRIAELESENWATQEERAAAMREAVKLHEMMGRLEKQVRRNFPQWKIAGA
jgi:hypothetical protein